MDGSDEQQGQDAPQPATVEVTADEHKALQQAHEELQAEHESFKQEVAGKLETLMQLLHLHGIRPKVETDDEEEKPAAAESSATNLS